jgi:hypothetical protein
VSTAEAESGAEAVSLLQPAGQSAAEQVFCIPDLVERIMKFLSKKDILSLACVNRVCSRTARHVLDGKLEEALQRCAHLTPLFPWQEVRKKYAEQASAIPVSAEGEAADAVSSGAVSADDEEGAAGVADLSEVQALTAAEALGGLENTLQCCSLVFPDSFSHGYEDSNVWFKESPRVPLGVAGFNRLFYEEFPTFLDLSYTITPEVNGTDYDAYDAWEMTVSCNGRPLFALGPFAAKFRIRRDGEGKYALPTKRCMALYAAMVMREDPEWDGFLPALVEQCRQLSREAADSAPEAQHPQGAAAAGAPAST